MITSLASAIIKIPSRILDVIESLLFPTKPESSSEPQANLEIESVETESTEISALTFDEPKSYAAYLKESVTWERGVVAVALVVGAAGLVLTYNTIYTTPIQAVVKQIPIETATEEASAIAQYSYNFFADLMQSQTSPAVEAVNEQTPTAIQHSYSFLTNLMQSQTSPAVEVVNEQTSTAIQHSYSFLTDLMQPQSSPVEIATPPTPLVEEFSEGFAICNTLKKLIPLSQKIKYFTPNYLKKTAGRVSAIGSFFALKKLCIWAKSASGNQKLKRRTQETILAAAFAMIGVGYYNLPADYSLSLGRH